MPYPTIQKAEVLSFRLTLPLVALERLPDEVKGMGLTLSTEDGRLALIHERSRLDFACEGDEALLEAVKLENDPAGAFFHRVIGALMTRYHGDLHVKLTWGAPERAEVLGLAEIRIEKGETSYPALRMKNVVSMLRSAAQPVFEREAAEQHHLEGGALETARSSDEDEIRRLLDEGKRYFAEYKKLKGRG